MFFFLVEIRDTGATGKLTFREDGTRDGYIVDILAIGQFPAGFEQLASTKKVGGFTKVCCSFYLRACLVLVYVYIVYYHLFYNYYIYDINNIQASV